MDRPPQAATIVQLNPDAGDHAVTVDPRELEAVKRTADRSWQEFPYYGMRYGERGQRFGLSDGAWLVTLCDARPSVALEQIRWLGFTLSSRGMPQFLLESHLEFLREELTQSVPDRQARYQRLGHYAEALREQRQSQIPEQEFRSLAAAFEALAGQSFNLPRMGEILVSAVADEAAGVERAVASLEPWACDPDRFPTPWIEAVRSTIGEARARAGRRRR